MNCATFVAVAIRVSLPVFSVYHFAYILYNEKNNTYEATVILLARLNEMGYNVVTVSELLGEDLEPGRLYTQK